MNKFGETPTVEQHGRGFSIPAAVNAHRKLIFMRFHT
nr:MAG TPA: hypothetical protein [Caudoviricetes sp.]